jgi:hypothetical protein
MGDRNMMTIWLVIFTERMKYKPSLLYHQTLCQGRVSKAKKSAGMIQAGNKQELVAGRTMPGQQELEEWSVKVTGFAKPVLRWKVVS